MLGAADSTWSSTSYQGARVEASVSTAATTLLAATATTARRASTETWASLSPTGRLAKVGCLGGQVAGVFRDTRLPLSPSSLSFLSSGSPAKWSRLRCAHIPRPLSLLSRPPWYLEVKGKTKGQWRCGSEKKAIGVIPYESAGPGSCHFPLCLPPPQPLLCTGVLHTRGKRVVFTRLTVGTKDPLFLAPHRHTSLDAFALPPVPPPSHNRDTHRVTGRLAVSGSGS